MRTAIESHSAAIITSSVKRRTRVQQGISGFTATMPKSLVNVTGYVPNSSHNPMQDVDYKGDFGNGLLAWTETSLFWWTDVVSPY